MQVIEVDGDDGFERGRAYGAAVAHVVPTLWASYLTLFERRARVSEAMALRAGEAVLARVQEWRPALAEEMEGVAAGAGVRVELVAALNARSEIVTGTECTTGGEQSPPVPGWRRTGTGSATFPSGACSSSAPASRPSPRRGSWPRSG